MFLEKFVIFVGGFGSGKSELAINEALKKVREGRCSLVDLDIVNPYFRSGERGDVLGEAGVRLIAPPFALHKIEITSLSPEIFSIFTAGPGWAVIDAGGDPIGATALGQYKPNFDAMGAENVETLLVVNCFRPLADTVDKAIDLMRKIEFTSRQSITGLVNNANLVDQTTAADIAEGYETVREMSIKTGIPVRKTSGTKKALDAFEKEAKRLGLDSAFIGELTEIDINMHRTWDRYIKDGL